MLKKFLRDCDGNNLLEGAMVTPLLLLLTFGVVDFASMFHVYVAMESGISQATRFAVTGATKPDPTKPGMPMGREGTIKAAMQDASPSLNVSAMTFTFSHMTPGSASWAGGAGGPGRHRPSHGQLQLETADADSRAVPHRRQDDDDRRVGDED